MKTNKTIITLIALVSLAGVSHADSLYWSPPSGTNWSTTDVNWSDTSGGSASQAWPSGGSVSDIAVFDGTGTGVSVLEALSAGGMRFETSGYAINASATTILSLVGASPEIYVTNGATATLGNNIRLDGAQLIKTGSGELLISGNKQLASGNYLDVQEGKLRFNVVYPLYGGFNSHIQVNIASGATLETSQNLGMRTLTGNGTLAFTSVGTTTMYIKGLNGSSFDGVISGNVNIAKVTETANWTLAGDQSNTFTGEFSLSIGTVYLAKENGATAVSGSMIKIGSLYSASTIMQLNGDNQIADTTGFTFIDANNVTAALKLNGYSDTLGALTVNGLNTNGINIIDYGDNLLAQTLHFSSLSIADTGFLQITNFNIGLDYLLFTSDPTSQLSRLQINGENATAFNDGSYWNVIPEPSTALLTAIGFLVIFYTNRRSNTNSKKKLNE